jgi:hypothetical protein
VSYWLWTLALVIVGFLTGFSIGPFLLLVGFTMLVLGPFRHRPLIYWPPIAAAIAFIVGYLAVAPFYCAGQAEAGGTLTTTCSSLAGIQYAGTGVYNPSLLPGIYSGLTAGALAALLVGVALWRRSKRGLLRERQTS